MAFPPIEGTAGGFGATNVWAERLCHSGNWNYCPMETRPDAEGLERLSDIWV